MESIFEESLGETHKPFNRVKKFEEEIKMFHDHGIMVNPGIVFGFDNDDESVFERTVEFLIKNHCELAYFNVLTPLPGTPLHTRLEADGRIFDRNWARYDGKYVTFYPKRMTAEQLQEGFYWAQHTFYSLPNIWRRVSNTSQRIIPRFEMNRQFRRVIKRACPLGQLSPVAGVIKALQAKIPSVEMENPIPNALLALKKVSGQVDQFLSVKARKHEKLTALLVELEGALDRFNAAELKKKLADAASQAKLDIIVNFEHLRHVTPQALQTLLDGEFFKQAAPSVRVRFRKLRAAFDSALAGMSFHGLDLLEEDLQDA
jgi:anti-anti-sigma regulatory factor